MVDDRAKRSARFAVPVLVAVVVAGCWRRESVPMGGIVRSVPGISAQLHVPLERVQRISRFRSGVGHDYSDGVERCRSMKHYFQFTGGEPGERHEPSWTTVPIVSPLDGVVVGIDEEWAGDQVRIRSLVDPRYTVIVFHVRRSAGAKSAGVEKGTAVRAGQALGFHASDETMSDVAVEVADASAPQGRRLVSVFDVAVMSDEAYTALTARGVAGRAALIVDKAERDADPMNCDGERFTSASRLAEWVELSAPSDPRPGFTPTP